MLVKQQGLAGPSGPSIGGMSTLQGKSPLSEGLADTCQEIEQLSAQLQATQDQLV